MCFMPYKVQSETLILTDSDIFLLADRMDNTEFNIIYSGRKIFFPNQSTSYSGCILPLASFRSFYINKQMGQFLLTIH
jgi:hypothetical protein